MVYIKNHSINKKLAALYCIRTDNNKKDNPIIFLDGYLDNSTIIEPELIKILNEYKDHRIVTINLRAVTAVSECCLLMFKRLQSEFPIQFRLYSLYIEMLFKENKLLDEEVIRQTTL